MALALNHDNGGAMSERIVIAYERVSTEKQDIARQALQRERAAADYPDAELHVIQDDGVSAYKVPIFERLGGRQLCDLIGTGTLSTAEAISVGIGAWAEAAHFGSGAIDASALSANIVGAVVKGTGPGGGGVDDLGGDDDASLAAHHGGELGHARLVGQDSMRGQVPPSASDLEP